MANREYNPTGSVAAVDYTLPYPDCSFDLVVLYSVFTHMMPDDMAHYVEEIARVLVMGGRCYATYLIVSPEAQRVMQTGSSLYDFKYNEGHHWLLSETTKSPELGIGYDDGYIRGLFADNGLALEHGIFFGSWSGIPAHGDDGSPVRDELGFGQDVVVGTKRAPVVGAQVTVATESVG